MFRYDAHPDRKRKLLQILMLISYEPVFKSVHCPAFAPKEQIDR